jgi:NTP pyrophosphatase (non-canonical NTP hydrolase)
MDRYERNIKQIEDAGKCPLMYFLEKTQEESVEVIQAINFYIQALESGDPKQILEAKKHLQGERADLKNCLAYLDILCKDEDEIARIMREKVDRGYERGVD